MVEDRPAVSGNSLDHVALRVVDRDAVAAELTEHFELRVIERTDTFTLVGASFRFGKITLLDAVDGDPPVLGGLVSLVLAEAADRAGNAPRVLENGLIVTLQPGDARAADGTPVPRHALIGVSLRSDDPPIAAAQLEGIHGMQVASVRPDVAVLRVGPGAGDGRITLSRERSHGPSGTPMLDHIGVRVDDAAAWRERVEGDATVVRWVDAAHSRAVFVEGPERLLLEFVQHTAPIQA